MDYWIRKQLNKVTFVVGTYFFQSKSIGCNYCTAHFGIKTQHYHEPPDLPLKAVNLVGLNEFVVLLPRLLLFTVLMPFAGNDNSHYRDYGSMMPSVE